MTLIELMHEHWFVTWCALWLVWGVFWIAAAILNCVFLAINRLLRTVKVLCRGWPPAHLDADGDWRPLPKAAKS